MKAAFVPMAPPPVRRSTIPNSATGPVQDQSGAARAGALSQDEGAGHETVREPAVDPQPDAAERKHLPPACLYCQPAAWGQRGALPRAPHWRCATPSTGRSANPGC